MHQHWEACPPPLAGRGENKDAASIQKTRKRGVEVCVLIKIMTEGVGVEGQRALRWHTRLLPARSPSPRRGERRHKAGAVNHTLGPTHCKALMEPNLSAGECDV